GSLQIKFVLTLLTLLFKKNLVPQLDLILCFQIKHKSTERQVDIKIKKKEERWWDRLTLQEKKPLFLAPDFDRWLDESDAEMDHFLSCFHSIPGSEEKLLVHVQPRAVPGILLGLCQHDCPPLHSWSRFVKRKQMS
uniref:CS domain-containing protein n=1 Tax=Haplochromis burtoni TaxID=8153 RepID=A0A3Q2W9M8_HAPBU